MTGAPWYRPAGGGFTIDVHVQPGAARTAAAGLHGERIKLRLAARPVEGAANEALIAFIAECLGLPKRSVAITSGEHSRSKRVAISGCAYEATEVLRRLGA